MITHYDLFAGIGGFSLALEEVFDDPIKHIFCEWESFPAAVLKQHWPNGEYWGNITELVADTKSRRPPEPRSTRSRRNGFTDNSFTIVTGGFPCQPFSSAGRRKGTADDRYQWPNMFEIVRNTKPEWVIAENVRGLVTWNEGMVLEQVCTDLESEGYEVQPFIIPAVAVNAPHRRDRVWIIGHAKYNGLDGTKNGQSNIARDDRNTARQEQIVKPTRSSVSGDGNASVGANTERIRRQQGRSATGSQDSKVGNQRQRKNERFDLSDWQRDWRKVALATCNDSVDDGLSRIVDGVPISRAKWRQNSLKAYGNGIVHQVAIEIIKAIKEQNNG